MIEEKIKTQKNLVKKLRAVRDQINLDIEQMTLEEEMEYINKLCAQWPGAPTENESK